MKGGEKDMNKEFDEIYRLYSADLYHFILNMCRNEASAMDIMQETMLRAIENINKFKGNCSIKTYLFTIARNLYLDSLLQSVNLQEKAASILSGEYDRITNAFMVLR